MPRAASGAVAAGGLCVLALCVLALVLAFGTRGKFRRGGSPLASLATFYGLTHAGPRVSGWLDGFGLVLIHDWRRRGFSREGKEPCTRILLTWDPPMDLGLRLVAPRLGADGPAAWLYHALSSRGRPSPPPRPWIFVNEPARVAPILHAVADAMGSLGQYELTDHGLRVEMGGHVGDLAYLASLIDRMLAVARMVREARTALRVAAPLAPFEPLFAAFARSLGLSMSRCPFAISGKINGCETRCYARRNGQEYDMVVDVYFPEPLPVQLSIEAVDRSSWLPFFGRRGIDFDDLAFDRTFRVNAANEALVRRSLDRSLRDVLRRLHERHPIAIFDNRISTTLATLDFGHVPYLVPQLQALATYLHGRFAGAIGEGAGITPLRLSAALPQPGSPRSFVQARARWATVMWALSILFVTVSIAGIGFAVGRLWREPRVSSIARYVNAIHEGRFDDARAMLLRPENMSRAEFIRDAHKSVFRRTRSFKIEALNATRLGFEATVRADGSLVCFELDGDGDSGWKVRRAKPGACSTAHPVDEP